MSESALAAPVTVAAHPLRILLIEDCSVDALRFERLLAKEFQAVKCVHVTHLAEADQHLAYVDAVILDLTLPDATPAEATAWIQTCPLPVVVHSGSIDRETVAAVAQAGALNYVCKGSSVQQMVVGVEFAMEEHRRAKDKQRRRRAHIADLVQKLAQARSATGT